MGHQSTRFASTIDIMAIRDQLRYLLGNLERFRAGGKQSFGRVVDIAAGGKQRFGRPVDVFAAAAGKQTFGRPVNVAAGGKHMFGFAVDVIRVLQELHARIDTLGSRAGMVPGELDLATTMRRTLQQCAAENMDRDLVEKVFQEQLDIAFAPKENAGKA